MELLLKQKVLNFITFYVLTNLVYHITIMVEIKKDVLIIVITFRCERKKNAEKG